jgi:tetratricopeptide (TPR) repeat protein
MRARLVLHTIAVVLALGTYARAQEAAAPEASFEAGVRALKAGRLDEAEKAFRAVLAEDAADAHVHNNLGIVLQQRGRHEEAVAEFKDAIRLDPAYVAPRILLGASLRALGRGREAKAILEEAVKLAPKEPLARAELARTLEQGGDWIGAVEQYRALREVSPRDSEYAYDLGNAYLHLSEWCLQQLDTVSGGSARRYQALGYTYRVQGRPDLALEAFARAAQADPALPEVHLAMAQIHMEQGRWAEARQEIERELALVPDSAGARALAAQLRAREAGAP